jgi:hypothetical protein
MSVNLIKQGIKQGYQAGVGGVAHETIFDGTPKLQCSTSYIIYF